MPSAKIWEVFFALRRRFCCACSAMTFRLFCALPVPIPVQNELVAAANSFCGVVPASSVSWIRAGNFHLTLCFLGEIEESRVDTIAAHLDKHCLDLSRFELRCRGLGCFPNVRRPRIVWAGLQIENGQLARLQNRVAAACQGFAQREEKGRFKEHITLGRIRNSQFEGDLAGAIERNRDTVFGSFWADEVQLVRSDLSRGTPRYSVLHRVTLRSFPIPEEIAFDSTTAK